jgi:outer membrane protein assembly factor BamA
MTSASSPSTCRAGSNWIRCCAIWVCTSELTGDKGIAGKVELQYDQGFSRVSSAAQFYGFYDVGVVGNSQSYVSIPSSQSLASTGVGVRITLPLALSGSLELAKPLTRKVEAEMIIGDHNPRALRGYFSIARQF